MWILQSEAADAEAMIFRIPPGAIKTVGRAARADFIVDAALVSRLHCRLTATEDRIDVEDLQSTNGTFVNDARIERGCVSDGDWLRVGRVELKVARAVPEM
jgi:pSer/pThr/pTyr-binding forkhead associated (FHA) protein